MLIVGDFNVSHKPIDTCDPGDDLDVSIIRIIIIFILYTFYHCLQYFTSSPSRQWFSKFVANGVFIDTFRYLHPDQREAYTCWETLSSARVNNYGVRIDYILCDGSVSKSYLVDCQHRTEVESSDHCPVVAEFNFMFKDRSQEKPPSICTKCWPEFKGTQMKLSQFMVKKKRTRDEDLDNVCITIEEDEITSIQTTNKSIDVAVRFKMMINKIP